MGNDSTGLTDVVQAPPDKIIDERLDQDRNTTPQSGEHRTVFSLLGHSLGMQKQGATGLGMREQLMSHCIEGEPSRVSGVNPTQ